MPLDPVKITLAVQSGLSVVCATCTNYWEAIDRSESWCGKQCGGPMSGGAFDKYNGLITDFSNICFVCGEKATHAIRAIGNVRVLGCCPAHVDTVKQWKPVNKPAVNIVIISPGEERSTDEMVVPPTRVRLKIING